MAGIIIIIKERDYGHPEKPPLTRKAPGRVDLISWLTERWRGKKKKKKNAMFQPLLKIFLNYAGQRSCTGHVSSRVYLLMH